MGIIALRLDMLHLLRVVERAAREAATVIGDNRVAVSEIAGHAVKCARVAASAVDQKQERAASVHLIVKICSRHAQRVAFHKAHIVRLPRYSLISGKSLARACALASGLL